MNALRSALFALLASLALALLSSAPVQAEQDQTAILLLVVNHAERHEATVVLRGKDVLVAPEDLRKAGVFGLPGQSTIVGGRRLVSLSSLSSTLEFFVDEAGLALRINAHPSALAPTVVNLRPSAPPDLVHHRDTSAFLNYAVRAGDFRDVSGFGEIGLSVGGALLFSSASASTTGGVVRGLSNLTFDDRAGLKRWVVGDTFVSGGALGGGLFTAGLTLSRRFELDPYFVHHPSFGFSTSALTPSTLDVYVNGQLVRSQPVQPGVIDVKNLPVPSGAGELRYVLRDVFGREQRVSSPYYASERLLAKGLSDYTYSLGVRRDRVGAASFDYGPLGFLGQHRFGLTDSVTAGGRIELAPGTLSGGAGLTAMLPIGQIDLSAAASASGERGGAAAFASYAYQTKRFGVSGSVRLMTAGYANLSMTPQDRRSAVEVSALTSVMITNGMSFAAQYAFAADRDAGPSFRVGASTSAQIDARLGLMVSASRSILPDGTTPMDLFVTLTCTLDGNVTAALGASYQNGKSEGTLEVNKPLPRGTGYGFRALGVLGDDSSATAGGQYQTSFGRYQATASYADGKPHLSLDAAGAVVAVKGAGLFLSRPVQDGFAVIRVPGVAGVAGYIDNQPVGKTDRDGNLLIPDLLPYYGNRLRVSDSDLPLDYMIRDVERVVAPPLRGGALVTFSVQKMRFYRGKLVVMEGEKRVVPSYGELSARSGGKVFTSPLAEDGTFDLEGIGPGAHAATIRYAGGDCAFDLRLPESNQPVVEVGELRCAR